MATLNGLYIITNIFGQNRSFLSDSEVRLPAFLNYFFDPVYCALFVFWRPCIFFTLDPHLCVDYDYCQGDSSEIKDIYTGSTDSFHRTPYIRGAPLKPVQVYQGVGPTLTLRNWMKWCRRSMIDSSGCCWEWDVVTGELINLDNC